MVEILDETSECSGAHCRTLVRMEQGDGSMTAAERIVRGEGVDFDFPGDGNNEVIRDVLGNHSEQTGSQFE